MSLFITLKWHGENIFGTDPWLRIRNRRGKTPSRREHKDPAQEGTFAQGAGHPERRGSQERAAVARGFGKSQPEGQHLQETITRAGERWVYVRVSSRLKRVYRFDMCAGGYEPPERDPSQAVPTRTGSSRRQSRHCREQFIFDPRQAQELRDNVVPRLASVRGPRIPGYNHDIWTILIHLITNILFCFY